MTEKALKYLLLLVIFSGAVIQIWYVKNTVDTDTDSYVHYTIARELAANPANHSMHWVWLPLYHYILLIFVKLNLGFQYIRYFNVILWVFIPLLTYKLMNDAGTENKFKIFLTSVFTAIFPLGFTMAVTGQPEPLFIFLFLLFINLIEKEKFIASSVILSMMMLLRYEALSFLGVCTAYILYKIFIKKNISYKSVFVILLPAAVFFFWLMIRFESIHSIFNFFTETKIFVTESTKEKSSFDNGFIGFITDFIKYPILIPFYYMGVLIAFLPLGVLHTFKKYRWFTLNSAALLIFIMYSFISRSNLGLARHFICLIPFYAFAISEGIFVLSNKISKGKRTELIASVVIVVLAGTMYSYWIRENILRANDAFPERKQAAEYLKHIPKGATIFCDDSVIEILSNLNKERFNRVWQRDDEITSGLIKSTQKPFYIVTDERKFPFMEKYGKTKVIFNSNEPGSKKIFVIESGL